MVTSGDDCAVSAGLIKGEEYSYLTNTNTTLFVRKPEQLKRSWKLPLFFLGISLSVMAGLVVEQGSPALFGALTWVVLFTGAWLIRNFRTPTEESGWQLYLGSAHEPIVIYSSFDENLFQAKRTEIEQALLGATDNEEDYGNRRV